MNPTVVDTRDLEAPEPLERVLEALHSRATGEFIVMIHRKEPCLLFPILEKDGYSYRMEKKSDAHFEVTIWKPGE